jgi:non-lysosomal glucosylceramidase
VIATTGVTKEMRFGDITGTFFWSDGYSYGTAEISDGESGIKRSVLIKVLNGKIDIGKMTIDDVGSISGKKVKSVQAGGIELFAIR